MKKILIFVLALGILSSSSLFSPCKAAGQPGDITLKSVGAGLLSLIIWPGIGQAVNDQEGGKVTAHALIGLFPPFRFWSGYDALVDRDGGYWKGRI